MFRVCSRLVSALVLASWGAALAFAQTSDELRPAIDEIASEPDVAEPEVTRRPKVTRLEAGAEVEQEIRRPRQAADGSPYDASGLDIGAFRVFPVLRSGAVLSDNPALAGKDGKADAGVFLQPDLKVRSEWARHQFEFEAKSDLVYFFSESSADAETADITSRLRLDVHHTTTLDVDAAWSIETANDPGETGKSGYDHDISAFASLTHRMGDLALRGRVGALTVLNGTADGVDQSDLDYVQPEIALRGTYELSPALKPYVEAGYRPRVYFDKRDRNGVKRSSQGVFGGAGFEFTLDPFWSASAGGTYTFRDYDDGALDNTGSAAAIASLTWKPTTLTEVTLSASTELSDSSSSSVDGDRGYTFEFDASHALRDNITLNASASVAIDDVAAGDDYTYTAGADVIYRVSPWLAFTASYDFLAFEGVSDPDYTENRVTAGIELRR